MLLFAISRSDVVVAVAVAVSVAVRLFDCFVCLFVCLLSAKSKSKVASIQFELCVSKIAKPRTTASCHPPTPAEYEPQQRRKAPQIHGIEDIAYRQN